MPLFAPTWREGQPLCAAPGIDELDILHAVEDAAYLSEPDDDMPAKQIVLGFDPRGRLLELAVLTFDSGNQLVFMP